MALIVFLLIIWRVFLFLLSAAGRIFFAEKIFPYTSIWYFVKPYIPVSLPFLYPWANFDGVHYLIIAAEGYTQNLRFFPLYPMLIKLFSFGDLSLFSGQTFFAGLIIAHLCFIAAFYLLYKLISLDYSKKIAIQSLLFLLFFPTSFFFVSIYSESLFLFLILISFYAMRKKRWFLAGACGALASLTRFSGIVMMPVILVEYFIQKKKIDTTALISSLMASGGTIAFMAYNYILTKDPLYFLHAQGELANGRLVGSLIFPLQTVYRYLKIFLTVSSREYVWWVALLEFGVFLFGIVGIYLLWKKKIRGSYAVYALFSFLIPVLTGTFTGLPRYILVIFPFFLVLALIKNRLFKIAYVVIGVFLLALFTLLFSANFYVG
ncbi:MAG: mannosyltransferase family protein [bacterium]|nr:mannosyltransferase family protein [bacterium]